MKASSLVYIIFTLILTACGSPKVSSVELQYFEEVFNEAALERGSVARAVPMVLVDSFSHGNQNSNARCMSGGWIEVKKSSFKSLSSLTFEAILYHEQGHCSLGLEHVSDSKHLMHETVRAKATRLNVDQLFN